jgi:hypothetical protein
MITFIYALSLTTVASVMVCSNRPYTKSTKP